MKKFALMIALALSLTGCEQQDKVSTPVQGTYDADDTGKNVRDRDSMTKTPLDQSESEADRTLTQKVRQMIMSDDSLSVNAKNIKIITINGVVTLRGPVANARERDDIAKKINGIQGIKKLDNQLEVTRNNG